MEEKAKKEYFKYLKNREYDKLFPFECISKRISFLVMFSEIINNHPEELEESYKEIIIKRGLKPSEPLMDFIILDIRNFYHLAHRKFKDTIDYPSSTNIVRKLRDNCVAHMLEETPTNLIKVYEEFDTIGGFKKVYSDFIAFREFIFNKIKP